jgi:multicomponent Na+:H+ antiporter subunit F
VSYLALAVFFCLFFAVRGPRLTDKIIATNMIAIKTIVLAVMVGTYLRESYIVDIAMLFSLICFLCTFVFAKLILQFMYSNPEPLIYSENESQLEEEADKSGDI